VAVIVFDAVVHGCDLSLLSVLMARDVENVVVCEVTQRVSEM
jgi:hypothetical protein